jgi:hypothetical protein
MTVILPLADSASASTSSRPTILLEDQARHGNSDLQRVEK